MNPAPTPPPPPPPVLLPAYNMKALLTVLGVLSCLLAVAYLGMGIAYLIGGEFVLNSAPSWMAEGVADLQNPTTPASPEEATSPENKERTIQFIQMVETWLPYGHGLIATFVITMLLWAFAFGWMGIGCIQARKWARKIAVGAGWLHIGYIAICIVVLLGSYPTLVRLLQLADELVRSIPVPAASPTTPAPPMPVINPHAHAAIFTAQYVVSFAFSSVFGVILVVLFGLRNVKLTCEHYDPKPRWTDPLPMPVLIAVLFHLWVAVSALTALPMTPLAYLVYGKGAPFTFALLFLLTGALAAGTAWFMAQKNPLGWILALAGVVLQGALWMLGTRSLGDVTLRDMGARLNVPAEEWAKFLNEVPPSIVKISEIVSQTWLPQVLVIACFLGYLFWIRPHIFQAGKETILRQRPIPS